MPRCPSCYRRLSHGMACPRDGAMSRSEGRVVEPEIKPIVPGFTVGEVLGAGGFAAVWRARRDDDGGEVALKVGRDHRRLGREADVLARVGPPHVPQFYDSGRTSDGRVYIAMERLDGRTLAAELEALVDVPRIRWVRKIATATLDALAAVHSCALVHCDLKPENVFVLAGQSPAVRLIDFGLVRDRPVVASDRIPPDGTIVGTAEYMAPEQIRGDAEIDARTDLYAFGVIMYELLTLRPPFCGDLASIEHGHTSLRPPLLRQFAVVPQPVESAVLACLAKDRDKRPADADTVADSLVRAFARVTPHNTPSVLDNKPSLLVEKRQPAVLVLAETDAGTYGVNELVKQVGGFVAWQRGDRYLCVFSGLEVEDPGRSALEATHALSEQLDARAAIHLATVTIRPRRRLPPGVSGHPVDKPEKWLPQQSWQGVILTGSFAQTRLSSEIRPAPGHEGFFVLASEELHAGEETTLVGRADVMARAEDSFAACLATVTPGMFTILGDPGLGKSRLARDLARRASEMCPGLMVVFVQAARDPAGAEELVYDTLSEVVPSVEAVAAEPDQCPLALFIDDAHLASNDTLHWLEYATLNHPQLPLWIAVVAQPRLKALRSHWGDRANRHDLVTLQPLGNDAARALAAELLLPAEYPPVAFLDRMVAWTGGNPQLLAGLASELKRQGIVRKRAYGQGWHVATAEFDQFPAAATARQWLAARELAAMSPELAACVRVCSVMGTAFSRDELAFVQDAVERQGGAGTPIDTDIGLRDLVANGTLKRARSGRMMFTSPAFRDALYQQLSPSDRTTLHRYASQYWRSHRDTNNEGREVLEHVARHAGACGNNEEAARCYLMLGDRAHAEHDDVAAENHYSSALRFAGESAAKLRARALTGRGKARHRLYRTNEAYEDLQAARKLCETIDDVTTIVDTLLEEATAADTAANYTRAAHCTEEAQRKIWQIDDPALEVRLLLAQGRAAWRRGDLARAIDTLGTACVRAESVGQEETLAIARVLLAPAQVCDGRLDEAERVFDEAIRLCERTGNRLQLCSAYANRMFLWSARKQPERALDDLRVAMRIAREVGNPGPEHVATHNLAELLYWSGELDEALIQARRARDLQLRFSWGVPFDALLLARIHAARMEIDQAESFLASLEEECNPVEFEHSVRVLYHTMQLVLTELRRPGPPPVSDASRERAKPSEATQGDQAAGLSARWDTLVAEAYDHLPGEELVEVLWWRVCVAAHCNQWKEAIRLLGQARACLEEAPIWSVRIRNIENSINNEIDSEIL